MKAPHALTRIFAKKTIGAGGFKFCVGDDVVVYPKDDDPLGVLAKVMEIDHDKNDQTVPLVIGVQDINGVDRYFLPEDIHKPKDETNYATVFPTMKTCVQILDEPTC
ncbi:MAG: hypothetical protein ACLFU1_05200 [Alphaproteobacteria bacterium]